MYNGGHGGGGSHCPIVLQCCSLFLNIVACRPFHKDGGPHVQWTGMAEIKLANYNTQGSIQKELKLKLYLVKDCETWILDFLTKE